MNSPPAHRSAHPFSRELLLGWCLWLLACWFLSGWLEGTSAMSALPRMRTTQLLAWIGATLVWPAWRLSTRTRAPAGPSTICDVVSLWIGYQVLAARMWMDFRESLRAPLVDLVFTVSLIGAGLWVFVGRRLGATGRTVCMVLCVVTALGGSLMFSWLGDSAWSMAVSPPRAIWLLCSERSPVSPAPLATASAWIAGGWVVLWLVAGVTMRLRRNDRTGGAVGA